MKCESVKYELILIYKLQVEQDWKEPIDSKQ